jgi:hypothetical protein
MHAPKSRRPSRRARRECRRRRLLGEHHAVEAFVGRGQRREALRGVPVEAAAVHQHAADHDAMAGEELGRRMDHEMRALVERAREHRRGHGRIHQQRQAVLGGECRDRGHVEHVHRGIAHRLAEK